MAANLALRASLEARAPVPVRVPPVSLCTDNGAMIAACGYFRWQTGERALWDLDVFPSLRLS